MSKLHTALKHLHLRPVAYYPVYARIMGSVSGGVVLSQLLYWAARSEDEFYKTDEEIIRETGCSMYELKQAKQKLKSLTFISVERKGLPARTYYRVDWDALVNEVGMCVVDIEPEPECDSEYESDVPAGSDTEEHPTSSAIFAKQVRRSSPNKFGDLRQTIPVRTENNTESTLEIQSSTGGEPPPPAATLNQPPEKQPDAKRKQLRLRVDAPPKKQKPNDYYHEAVRAFEEVTGSTPDALAVRACLSAWKDVREGRGTARGLSAEEITDIWKRARERASPERREYITLLWVLNNGEKARKLATYQPKPDPSVPIDQTAEVVRLYFEAKAKREAQNAGTIGIA